MAYDDVQELVARCLVDPMFLDQARNPGEHTCPEALRSAKLLGSQGLDRLLLVRGMITKVKHNALKNSVPLTMRLIDKLGLELPYFTWVSIPFVQRRSEGPMAMNEFLDFSHVQLERFLSEKQVPEKEMILDLLTHETLIWNLTHGAFLPVTPATDSTLSWCGRMELRRVNANIFGICQALRNGVFEPKMAETTNKRIIGYWRSNHAADTKVFEVPPHSAIIFSLIDGQRGADEILALLREHGFGEIGPERLHAFLEDASKQGFLDYREPTFREV